MVSWRGLLAAGCGALLLFASLSGGRRALLALAVAPAVATLAAIATLATRPWYGRTPALVWLASGSPRLALTALGPPLTVGLMVGMAGALSIPVSQLPGYALYLTTLLLLLTGTALFNHSLGRATVAAFLLLALIYGLPLYTLAVVELIPRTEISIAAALTVWPPALAAGLLQADLLKIPWFYNNLPVAYYPYTYPHWWQATACLAPLTLVIHGPLWLRRTPPAGWV